MSDHTITSIVSVLLAITGLAILALLVSKSSGTVGVFTSGGGAFQMALCQALAPVTGHNCTTLKEEVNSTITFGNVPIP